MVFRFRERVRARVGDDAYGDWEWDGREMGMVRVRVEYSG